MKPCSALYFWHLKLSMISNRIAGASLLTRFLGSLTRSEVDESLDMEKAISAVENPLTGVRYANVYYESMRAKRQRQVNNFWWGESKNSQYLVDAIYESSTSKMNENELSEETFAQPCKQLRSHHVPVRQGALMLVRKLTSSSRGYARAHKT